MTAFLNSPSRRFQSHIGYWSWTDGSSSPIRSMAPDGSVEAVTVKPAFFRTPGGPGGYTFPGGWLAPESRPQHQGATLLVQMRAAMKAPRPKFVIISQWNEFTATACSSQNPGKKFVMLHTRTAKVAWLTRSDTLLPPLKKVYTCAIQVVARALPELHFGRALTHTMQH
jgi:hypothetical protein